MQAIPQVKNMEKTIGRYIIIKLTAQRNTGLHKRTKSTDKGDGMADRWADCTAGAPATRA